MNEKKYRSVKKKYLADALAFLGFKYYKFSNKEGISYSFEDTDKLKYAIDALMQIKQDCNS
jgi:hypothetical protein